MGEEHHPTTHNVDTESEEEEDDWGEPTDLPDKNPADRKGRRGVSAESFGSWNKKEAFEAPVIPKSEATKKKIRARLSDSFLFNSLEPKEMTIVIEAMKEVNLKTDEAVIVEGDNGDYLYVVETGT
jgi:cAMP-dependent protein kinase regulator